MAALSAVAVLVVTVPAAVAIFAYLGGVEAGAFVYGVGVGLITFVSIAVTVSLLTGHTTPARMMFGAVSYFGRLLFAAVAVGTPAYLGLWPLVPMLGGFGAVYVIENVAVLVGAWKMAGGRKTNEKVERRVGV